MRKRMFLVSLTMALLAASALAEAASAGCYDGTMGQLVGTITKNQPITVHNYTYTVRPLQFASIEIYRPNGSFHASKSPAWNGPSPGGQYTTDPWRFTPTSYAKWYPGKWRIKVSTLWSTCADGISLDTFTFYINVPS